MREQRRIKIELEGTYLETEGTFPDRDKKRECVSLLEEVPACTAVFTVFTVPRMWTLSRCPSS